MTKRCHFWNAKYWTKAFAYIIAFTLPLKPVSTGIITSVLQMWKLLLREVIRVPKVT